MPASPPNLPAPSDAERLILERLSAHFDAEIAPGRLYLDGGAFVDLDGVAADGSILVEVFAHSGGLKGGQRQKIATDILKLITIARELDPRPRLILAVSDPAIENWTAATNWHAGAIAAWEIETVLVSLDEPDPAPAAEAQVRPVPIGQ